MSRIQRNNINNKISYETGAPGRLLYCSPAPRRRKYYYCYGFFSPAALLAFYNFIMYGPRIFRFRPSVPAFVLFTRAIGPREKSTKGHGG